MAELRPYQAAALARVRAEFARGARAVVVVAPTGAGKTVCMAEIARQAIARGRRVLLVVHRRELAKQALKHLQKNGIDEVRALLGGCSFGARDAHVVVATVQTITSKRWFAQRPHADLVMWDECHHCPARSFRTLREAYPEAKHLGFTATPERADGTALGDIFDALVPVATIRTLIELGFLVPCRIWAPAGATTKLAIDPATAYVEHGEGRRAIIFCANVTHAKLVAAQLVERGVPTEAVDGSMPTRLRDAALARFASGQTQVVTNCNLITEGFDVPAAKCIVLARGCGSVAMYLQAIGRALRPDGASSDALLLDLRGAVYRHGLPDADREYSLDGNAITTTETPESITQCKSCGAVFRPRPTCPQCGFVREVPIPEVEPGVFSEVDRETFVSPGAYPREYAELRRVAAERGYRPGWAFYKLQERFGRRAS